MEVESNVMQKKDMSKSSWLN